MTLPQSKGLLNNRYNLYKVIGKGGMAVVYLGRDLMLERNVAVKVLKADYSSDPEFRERFREEAKAVANLTHPNIVTVYDFGLDAKRLFIVMEYVPGKDLNTIIKQRGRLRIKDGIHLSIQGCMGIGYAHRAGFVHCDIKPHNLLVTPDSRLKVTDFGIARALASINPDEESDVVWGSPQYFSPEQASGSPPSPASDVYSMGVVMYQMFTGQPPFQGKTSGELARLHRSAVPIPPREFNPSIPQELEEVMLKILSKEPSSRYRTADQLGRVLQTIEKRYMETMAEQIEPAAPRPVQRAYSPTLPPLTRPTPAGAGGPAPSEPPPSQPAAAPPQRYTPQLRSDSAPAEEAFKIDWLAIFLLLIVLLAVFGLVPFWFWVITLLFP